MSHDTAAGRRAEGGPDAGFVFAATGERYIALARRAARALRLAMPEATIDLFADEPPQDDVFDQVHRTADDWFRPKMEALVKSRFRRTLYLDADILVISDVSDVFEILDRFELVAAHDPYSNSEVGRRVFRNPVPPAFPQFNGGVVGIKKSPRTTAFVTEWQRAVRDAGVTRDQPALRELLWDSDLRFYVLPRQFNFNSPWEIGPWTYKYASPRIVHAPRLHRQYVDRPVTEPIRLHETMSRREAAKLGILVDLDRAVSHAPAVPGPRGRLGRLARRALARLS